MGEIAGTRKIKVNKLIPYINNAKKHSEKQIKLLASSISEFGFLNPIMIDKDFNVIAGHGRLLACQRLGIEEVPCIFIEGLTEAQRKAYILADNRIAEFGSWDKELVGSEIEALADMDIDFDIDSFEFDLPDIDAGYYGDERERTNDAYNLGIAHNTDMTNDFWQMPVIKNDGFVPNRLIGFNYAKSSKDKDCGIHFFVDDYQFERIWNYPEKYVDILSGYECILSPDFSLYMDMPMPMKIWNIYRSRQIGAYYQRCGIKVIPTVSWAEAETFQFAFKGIEKGSIVATSTIGVKEDADALKIWRAGMDAMIDEIHPSIILCYGGKLDFDYRGIEVKYYDNEVLKNWKVSGNVKD